MIRRVRQQQTHAEMVLPRTSSLDDSWIRRATTRKTTGWVPVRYVPQEREPRTVSTFVKE